MNSIASSFLILYYLSKNSKSASNSKDCMNYKLSTYLSIYFLGSHDVELEEVEGAPMLLGVEGVVDHEVGSYKRFLGDRLHRGSVDCLFLLRRSIITAQRGNLASLAITINLLHLLIFFLLLLQLFLTLFYDFVRKHIVIAIEKSASKDNNTNVNSSYISHLYIIFR